MSKCYHIDSDDPSAEVINLAATVLRDGGIAVFPTETVYGLGALADSKFGPHEIFEVKVRPANLPIPLLVETEDALDTWGVSVPEYAHNIARAFWPGAVTLVVNASEKVPRDFRAEDGTIGLRSPDHEVVRELLQAAGGPIFATSANTHGNNAPNSYEEIELRIITAADIVLDGGETQHQMASTVVLCTGDAPEVVREGAVPTDQIMASALSGAAQS
ncbi:MAG: threonylcarbamoyl-AMP synthase [Actinobacteria bacterium HGW-Actinobacteria-7]|nr:MAG: threonylcarbamoyl-AMP synthase [Actinobacteria bacterium HGW-Actinobacteria-7]